MKQMQKDPLASDRARKAERRADEKAGVISIKPVKLDMGAAVSKNGGGGFKKGGFKSAFGGADVKKEDENAGQGMTSVAPFAKSGDVLEDEESDSEDEYEHYDPRKPTGCWEGCPSHQARLSGSERREV